MPSVKGDFDYLGSALLALGLGALFLSLNQQVHHKIYFFIAALSLLGIFIFKELKTKHPIIEVRLFKSLVLSSGMLARLLFTVINGSCFVLIPFFARFGLELSAVQAGFIMLSFSLGQFLCGFNSGYFYKKIGNNAMAYGGFILSLIGVLILSSINYDPNSLLVAEMKIILCLLFVGLGMGIFVPSNNGISFHSVPTIYVGMTSGCLWSMHYLGLAIGALLSSLLINHVTHTEQTSAYFSIINTAADIYLIISITGVLICIARNIVIKKWYNEPEA